jgi:DNA-binding NarL/FixJ family response regulator
LDIDTLSADGLAPESAPADAFGVMVVGDSALCRYGVAAAIRELFPSAAIQDTDCQHAIRRVAAGDQPAGGPIDLVLFDMTGLSPSRFIDMQRLMRRWPDARLVAVCANADADQIMDILGRGARGVVMLGASLPVLRHALGLVQSGGIYVPDGALRSRTGDTPVARRRMGPIAGITAPQRSLTARQRQIAELLAVGKSNKEIARALSIEEGTVKIHVKAILRALGVRNRTEAVLVAARAGYIDSSATR